MNTWARLRDLLVIVVMLPVLGCSGQHHRQLEVTKKQRLVAELIASAKQCDAYKTQLANPRLEDDGVDAVYHAAMAAHCLKKDV